MLVLFSSNAFSSSHTGGLVDFLVKALQLPLGSEEIESINHLLRKCGHLSAYALLAWCWQRALKPDYPRWGYLWVLLICVGMASWDEWNQSLLSDRSGSPADVAIDLLGSFCVVALDMFRQKRISAGTEAPAEETVKAVY